MKKLHDAKAHIQVIMHCDSTFKTNTVGYPVFVWGFSDVAGSFHLVALYIVSRRREDDVINMLTSIQAEYERVNGDRLELDFFMGDADFPTRNAVARLYPRARYLMCFFHVIMNVSNGY